MLKTVVLTFPILVRLSTYRETVLIDICMCEATAGKFVYACVREDARESLTNINKDGGKLFRMLFAFSLAFNPY